ncbi:peroxisomal membrane protein 2-like [Chrysoperla carnea]|uniref:peroxisomal membrane protein 2-like n=1 Tax=Chrysoperla carnea TaxID=189513 RepID=UPI001D08A7E8|nr:peroxisomal membrane protein 2-like [Chrysoperla carnea]
MALSRPLYDLLGSYLMQLYSNPIRTKSITSCVIATSGNLVAQYISGTKFINQDSLIAYGLYGLFFGGTIPHYFYMYIERLVPKTVTGAVFIKILIERLLYSPLNSAFSLYMLARLEGKSHNEAIRQLKILYLPILQASWKYLTIIHILNFSVVPPMFRVLITNLVGFFWVIYLANKRNRRQQEKSK